MSLQEKEEILRRITREVPRETIYEDWGLPHEPDTDLGVQILDETDEGSGRWESYHRVIFVAPDDGKTYSVDYSQGLTEYQDQRPWEDEDTVTITQVERHERVITVTDWKPVHELPAPRVPTVTELKAQWAANREYAELDAPEW